MDFGFWIGLAVSIPLAIIANLMSPKIQIWIDNRSKIGTLKKTKRLKEDYLKAKYYIEHRDEFREYLLFIIIRTTYIAFIVGIISGFGALSPELIRPYSIGSAVYSIAQMFSIFGALAIVRICSLAIRNYNKIKNFKDYEQFVIKTIGLEEFNK